MGLRIDGTSDNISATDGSLTIDGLGGDGSNLTGISGFSTALASSGFHNHFYKTQKVATVAAGTSVTIELNDANCGNTVFTRLNRVNVGTGATFHVGAGTTLIFDVLGLYP